MPALIKRLNQTLRGWENYHRFVVSSRAYHFVDTYVHHELWRMVRRRHRNKSARWLYHKYGSAFGKSKTFSVEEVYGKTHKPRTYRLTKLSEIGIQQYDKIRAHANPYTKEDAGYFYKRRHDKKAKIAMTWGDVNGRVAPKKRSLETLEPCDGKLSRTVLRGEGGREAPDLPDALH